YMQGGAHSCAVWNCHGHSIASHFFATNGSSRFDVCYNRLNDLAHWNEYQTSAISSIGMPNQGTVWADGFMNHIVGNVIDATWIDASVAADGLTDGNGIIFDISSGYDGRSLVLHNLVVGCGGRGIHALNSAHVDAYLNSTADNVNDLSGTWDSELSI